MTETKATPQELLTAHILRLWQEQDPANLELVNTSPAGLYPVKLMDEVLENHDDGSLQDVIYGFRTDGGEATNIQQFDRNYEVEVRAVKIQGQWVGWCNLHGGGKRSNPETWPWIDNAFFIDLVSEEEVTITKRTFAYKED
jgi:hypothetical protein